MQKGFANIIRIYQKFFSFDTGIGRIIAISDKTCRFSPTCSEYTLQAVEKYGMVKGLFKGFVRIMRCNPLSAGGWDPVQ